MIERKEDGTCCHWQSVYSFFSIILMQETFTDLYKRSGHMTESVPGREFLKDTIFIWCFTTCTFCMGRIFTMGKRKNTPEYLTAPVCKGNTRCRMDGICYASMEGQPILVNRQMNEIYWIFISNRIMNANDFWEDLQNIQTSERSRSHRNETVFDSSIFRHKSMEL